MRLADLKAMALATVIALLIWIYAEGQSLTARSLSVPVGLSADAQSGLVIQIDDPGFRGLARVRLEGSARTIDDAANLLTTNPVRLLPGMPGMPDQPGENRTINLREAISALPELSGLGSSVADVDPTTITVRVVRVLTRELPVRVDVPADVQLDGEAQATPSQIMLRLPQAAADTLPESAVAIATIPTEDLARLGIDGPKVVLAKVRPPAGLENVPGVAVVPETVSVTLRPRRVVETYRLPNVPIWFSLPPTEDAGRWSIEMVDKFLTDVTISGPADAVRRVRDGQAVVRAVVELGSEDLQRGVSTKAVRFTGLPQGITATAANPEARLRVSRRAAATPAAGDVGPTP